MARFTSLEFMEALGLGYFDYNGAKILLRLLHQKGIAKEVDRISRTGKGRKMVVYELPEEITLKVVPTGNAPIHPPKKKRKKVEETEECVATEVDTQVVDAQVVDIQETHDVECLQSTAVKEYEFDEGLDED